MEGYRTIRATADSLMSTLVPIVLYGWLIVVPALFSMMSPVRAMIVSFVGAWMLLPTTGINIPGLPDYTKMTAAAVATLVGAAIFDPARLAAFRFSALDIPMLAWCLCPFASSIANGLGSYDGISAVVEHLIVWGLPYYLGRVYLTDVAATRHLAMALFIGGVVYIPLCLIEIRMSPQLNYWLYGFGGAGIEYSSELGKWGSRPQVFMGTALTLGLFMTASSLAGLWLWRTGTVHRVGVWSMGGVVAAVVVVSVACKNMGALSLLVAGWIALWAARRFKTKLIAFVLVTIAPLYMITRASGNWAGDGLVYFASSVNDRRAESIRFRLENEELLIEKALQRPAFGWGRWGRARVYAEMWDGTLKDVTVTDGLWVIAIGNTGLVGLASITAVLLCPAYLFLRRLPVGAWDSPSVGPAVVIAMLVVLYAIDNLFNAMQNPIYLVAAGGIVAILQADAVRVSRGAVGVARLPAGNPVRRRTGPRNGARSPADPQWAKPGA